MIKSTGVCIKTKDFAKSRAFYEGFGFKAKFEVGPDKEIKDKSSVVIYGSETGGNFELTDGHVAIKPAVFQEQVESSKISLMFEVSSLEEIMGMAQNMGVEPAVPVRHYYYGNLEVVFYDPDGTRVVFIEPYTAESAKKLAASEEFGEAINPV